jgi:hypothetical protein
MDYQVRPLYLRIQRKVISKPVLPFNPETKKIQIKFLGFFFREDTQEGMAADRRMKVINQNLRGKLSLHGASGRQVGWAHS